MIERRIEQRRNVNTLAILGLAAPIAACTLQPPDKDRPPHINEAPKIGEETLTSILSQILNEQGITIAPEYKPPPPTGDDFTREGMHNITLGEDATVIAANKGRRAVSPCIVLKNGQLTPIPNQNGDAKLQVKYTPPPEVRRVRGQCPSGTIIDQSWSANALLSFIYDKRRFDEEHPVTLGTAKSTP